MIIIYLKHYITSLLILNERMDTLNHDVSNIIFKQLPTVDRLRLYTVFNAQRPTQFQVSSELIASKGFRGNNGLMMRVITPDHAWNIHDDNREHAWNIHGDLQDFYPYQHVIALIEEQVKVGNYEPCVQAMVLIQKQLNIDPWTTRESDVREDVKNLRRQLRLLDIALDHSALDHPEINNRFDLCSIIEEMRDNMRNFRLPIKA